MSSIFRALEICHRWALEAFKYGRQAEQTADLWLPAGQSPKGVVVLLHGGFWLVQYGASVAEALASQASAA